MTIDPKQPHGSAPVKVADTVISLAKINWDADRISLKRTTPDWEMPAWSSAAAWRRRPYVQAAKVGRHPHDI